MNKMIVLAITVALLFSCKEKSNGVFTVTGNIKNAPNSKIYLQELPFAGTHPIIVDSATLQNGNFVLKTNTLEEGLYSIGFETMPNAVLLINNVDKIEVTLDCNNYKQYQTKGSEATTSLHKLFDDYTKKFEVLSEKMMILDSLQAQHASDSILLIAKASTNLVKQQLNNLLLNFIQHTESATACLHAMAMASRTIDLENLTNMVDESLNKFSANKNILKFKEIMIGKQYPLLGKQAPNFVLTTPNNDTVTLNNFKGKYVLVDFWASWCKPCRAENPNVVAMYKKYKDKNFTVLGVSLDEDKKLWVEAIAKDSLTWIHVSDLKQWESPLVNLYQFDGIPFNVLIDPNGKIIASGLREEMLDKKLDAVLK